MPHGSAPGRYLRPTNACCLPKLPARWVWILLGFFVSDACSRMGLWRAYGMADAARCCSGPLRSPNQCLLLAKASCLTLPPLLLAGPKVPNSSGSADQVATRWAWILLGFPCFGCVLTGDAGGCDVPLEWLMPHGFAPGRYVRPTNACRLPKLPASPVHLCF